MSSISSLVAACAPGGAATGPTKAAATAPALERVEIAFCAVPHCIIPFEAATRLGYFRQEGLDVTLQPLGPTPAMEALLSGSVDFAGVPIAFFAAAPSAGKPVVMVASVFHVAGGMILGNPRSPSVQSLKDLEGRRVAALSPNSPSVYLPMWAALTRQGVDPASLRLSGAPPGGCDALAASDLDAAWATDPCMTQLQRQGWRVLASFTSTHDYDALVGGPIPHMGLQTRPDVVQRRPETVRKLVRALTAANRWVRSTPGSKIVETVPQAVGTDAAIYAADLDQFRTEWYPADLAIPAGAMQRMLDVMRSAGFIAPDFPLRAEELYSNAFVPR